LSLSDLYSGFHVGYRENVKEMLKVKIEFGTFNSLQSKIDFAKRYPM